MAWVLRKKKKKKKKNLIDQTILASFNQTVKIKLNERNQGKRCNDADNEPENDATVLKIWAQSIGTYFSSPNELYWSIFLLFSYHRASQRKMQVRNEDFS